MKTAITTKVAPRPAKARLAPQQRKYDVVLYGATGFVGRQTAAYFAKLDSTPEAGAKPLRWALAGRSKEKLQAVKAACGPGAKKAGIVVADAQDAQALEAMARNCRVVLSTAGPFALHGSKLVAACVKHATHYVDITGETPWVHDMIKAHHATAQENGTRIIPFCGFDSVPSDLGSWLVAQTMQEKYGEPCESLKACFSLRGGVNGGTLASMFNFMDSGKAKMLANPFLLNPTSTRTPAAGAHLDPISPLYDVDFKAWLGPFFMGPINTRVVRRSAALLLPARGSSKVYSKDFHYQEYLRFGAGPLAGAAAAVVSAAMLAGAAGMKLAPLRRLASRLAPGPGTGPSEAVMDAGSFRCELVGKSASGHIVRGLVADKGDPGNRVTTKMVCESALALALQMDELPGGMKFGGVLTPAVGLGAVLIERLLFAGMTFEAS